MIKRIVLGLDGSPEAERALPIAQELIRAAVALIADIPVPASA